MAGTISLSLSQQFDELGAPLAEGRLYFYRAGTVSTPQNAFYDTGLTLPFPNYYTLDAAGRIPQFFLADGFIKVVLLDRHGTTQISADNILVMGPSSGGGGGGGSVDPTTVMQTGDVKIRYATGVHTGFVRCNGRTIGSGVSGATELASTSAQALFIHLYNEDPALAVSGGRGVDAASDFAANKTIALPDQRGKAISAVEGMGNIDSGTLAGVSFDRGNSTTLGSILGRGRRTLLSGNLPVITPAGSVALSLGGITVTNGVVSGSASVTSTNWVASNPGDSTAQAMSAGALGIAVSQGSGASVSKIVSTGTISTSQGTTTASQGASSASFTGSAGGGTSDPFDTISPYLLYTVYMKL